MWTFDLEAPSEPIKVEVRSDHPQGEHDAMERAVKFAKVLAKAQSELPGELWG